MNNYNVIWEYAGVQRKQQEILYKIQLLFLIVYGHIYHAVGYKSIKLKLTPILIQHRYFLDDSIIHGDQYLRRCESAAHAQRIIQKTLLNHGAINAVPNQIKCNYDGTYGELVIENPLCDSMQH